MNITKIGKGLRLAETKIVTLNRDFATWMLNEVETFVADRPLRNKWVAYLAEQMERRSYLPEQVTLVVCKLGERLVRMNGQHTSWAILEFDEAEAMSFDVNFMTYEADTEEDMRRLYASIDRGASRSQANVVSSYLAGTEHFGALHSGQIQLLSGGFSYFKWESVHDRSKHGGDDIAVLLSTDYLELSLRVADLVKGWVKNEHKHMKRVAVVGAIYATMAKSPKAALEFWARVADGLGMTSNKDPQYQLREFLVSSTVCAQPGVSAGKRFVSAEDVYRVCVTAWNIHRSGKEAQYFKPSAYKERPVIKK